MRSHVVDLQEACVSKPECQPFRVFAGINIITRQHPDTIVPEVLLK
jgi:hypothetical protein